MGAAAAATFALLVVVRGPGGAWAIVDAPPGSQLPETPLEGCTAVARGESERAPVSWTVAFDPAYTRKERFRDGRQVALYFVSHVLPGDRMNVVVVAPPTDAGATRASGFHGVLQLNALRAPLDATVEPTPPHASTDKNPMDLLGRALADQRDAAAGEEAPLLHLGVAIEEAPGGTRVRLGGDVLHADETIAEGASQARGPRLLAEVGARLAGVSRVHLELRCADAGPPSPPGSPDGRPSDTPRSRPRERLLGLAAAALVLAAGLGAAVWRRMRRG
jgi:hypothetical protein